MHSSGSGAGAAETQMTSGLHDEGLLWGSVGRSRTQVDLWQDG